jgi:serine/threonine-protein kinase RIO1
VVTRRREATSTTSHDVASPDADVVTAPPSQSDEPLIDASAPAELAVKIYKTSILVFKDRDRYVTGEFRFRQGTCADVSRCVRAGRIAAYRAGYSKRNPRKMVRVWAEKELRNLAR